MLQSEKNFIIINNIIRIPQCSAIQNQESELQNKKSEYYKNLFNKLKLDITE